MNFRIYTVLETSQNNTKQPYRFSVLWIINRFNESLACLISLKSSSCRCISYYWNKYVYICLTCINPHSIFFSTRSRIKIKLSLQAIFRRHKKASFSYEILPFLFIPSKWQWKNNMWGYAKNRMSFIKFY